MLATGGVGLSLNGVAIANNSYVAIEDIGEGDAALLCHTDKLACCRGFNKAGEWYYPSGTGVGVMGGSQDEFYRDRGPQVVRLNRRHGTFTERGHFRCEVPDASNITRFNYVNIGMSLINSCIGYTASYILVII